MDGIAISTKDESSAVVIVSFSITSTSTAALSTSTMNCFRLLFECETPHAFRRWAFGKSC